MKKLFFKWGGSRKAKWDRELGLLFVGGESYTLYPSLRNFLNRNDIKKVVFRLKPKEGYTELVNTYKGVIDVMYAVPEGRDVMICRRNIESIFGYVPENIYFK